MIKKITTAIFIFILLVSTSGCVRIIKEGEEGKYTGDAEFNAGDNVASIWDEQALPNLKEKAIDLSSFLNESNGDLNSLADKYGDYSMGTSGELSYTVKGKVTVQEVVSDKKAGYMLVHLEGYDGPVVIKIQIGSIFKGSSIRDSLDFIKFEDYKNQVDYAQISQSINDYIQKEMLDKIDLNSLAGKEIEFIGCFTVASQDEILIMPADIKVE